MIQAFDAYLILIALIALAVFYFGPLDLKLDEEED